MVIEICQGVNDRNHFYPPERLMGILANTDSVVYRSMWLYPDNIERVKGYDGPVFVDSVILDLDIDLSKLRWFVEKRLEPLNIPYQIYFSGRGFHIELPKELFDFKDGQPDTHKQIGELVAHYFPEADQIYDKARIYRAVHSRNNKTGLYKIPLDKDEVFNLSETEIKALAKQPRWEFEIRELQYEGSPVFKLTKFPVKEKPKTETVPVKKWICIQNILEEGPVKGRRHNTLLRLISHWKRQGYPKYITKSMALAWVDDDSFEKDIDRMIESIYSWEGYYSCKDPLLQSYCDKSCIFYSAVETQVMDIDEMEKEFELRMGISPSINLKDVFPGIVTDFVIYPSELVTLIGVTNMGKSSFVQNLMLGLKVPVLYLSFEMPGYQVYSRFLQILTGKSKQEIAVHFSEYKERYRSQLEHIMVATKPVYVHEIGKLIEMYSPALVVVDHILLMKSKARDDYGKVTEIMDGLKQIAIDYNVTIFAVSQTSRAYARDGKLDLFSGKGSGAIENDSDKILIYERTSRFSDKVRIFCEKDREGQFLDVTLKFDKMKIE